MQYEKTVSELKSYEPKNASLSLATQAAINKILNLDSLAKHDKDVVIASYNPQGESSTLDLTQDLKQIKGEKVVMLNASHALELKLPETTAKTFIFDSSADLKAAFKASGSVIVSGSGSDDLTIRGNKNLVEAGDGDDKVTTASGNDTINGGEGNDKLSSGNGNDSVSGGNGNDQIDGGNGNDSISGDAGNDTLIGGNGNDKLYGGTGDDKLDGGNGNDTLEGGAGNDTLVGGKGQDTYVWKSDAVNAGDIDHLTDGKGSKLVINFEGLKVNDQIITDLNKGIVHVGDTIDANNNIAFTQVDGKNMLQIDTDGLTDINGHYTADFQIEIVGTVKGVDFNAKTDTFTLI